MKNNFILIRSNTKASLLVFVLFFLSFLNSVCAQEKSLIEIKGVVKNNSKNEIPYATVALIDKDTNKPFEGAVSDEKGVFSLSTRKRNFFVKVSFVGYESKMIYNYSIINQVVDLKVVRLSETSESLSEVLVRAEKSTTEFKLDRRVFNVGKDLSSTGASALEVLNNVPSVDVTIEGAINLRGSSGVQMLINGKPSVIASQQGNALGTITADMIEKIEVITNPSAKYEAEGTTGIINIVLKKEERRGVNGSISLNTGTPQNHSVGVSLNKRTEKFNLFTQLGAGYREYPRYGKSINSNLISGRVLESDGVEYRNEEFYNFVIGTDYHIDKSNVVTLSGSYAYEIEDQPSETDFEESINGGSSVSQWKRVEVTNATNPKFQYELQYKSDFKDSKEHVLLFSALGSFFGKDQASDFENVFLSNSSTFQKTYTNYKEAKYTYKLDYSKPFSKDFLIEIGAQYVLQDVSNDFSVTDLLNNIWVTDPNQTNIFEYTQNVLGVYATTAYENDKFGLKLGLRAENTDLTTFLVTTKEGNDRNFTNLFPSVHTSYKISEMMSIQLGYSKRVYRPRLWDLNPFFNIRNTFTVRAGNPNLLPEFTDSYELSSIFSYEKLSASLGLYHRFTTDMIERVSIFKNDINIVTPLNIGTNKTYGVELNVKYSPNNNWTLSNDLNINSFKREGEYGVNSFNFKADRWSAKMTSKHKITKTFDFEVTGRYLSSVKTVQGKISEQLFTDLGVRKKLLGGKGVVSLGVRDLFASRIRESEISQTDFTIYNRAFRGRFVTLGFSYGFGKGEAMEYSGRRRFF